MEVQICSNCIVDSGFEEFGTVVAGDQPIACDVCGNEFWSLITAHLTPHAADVAKCPACGEDLECSTSKCRYYGQIPPRG